MNLLTDHATRDEIRSRLAPPDCPPILPPASSPAWARVFGRADLAHLRDELVDRARVELREPFPRLGDELYREFHAHGTRDGFQKAYYERRRRLGRAGIALLLASSIEQDDFADSFLEKLSAIFREKSWALPAHVDDPSGRDPLCIDLACAETAYLLAEALVVFGDFIPAALQKRIRERLRTQVFENYLERGDRFFWTSHTNNWNAVCHHGVLGAALAVEEDLDLVAALLHTARDRLALFLSGFTADGGCTEGLDYWSYGFGNFTALNELLEIRTGGSLSLFAGNERVRAIARYAPALSLAGGRIVNFADAKNIPASDWVLAYLGMRLDEPACRRQAAENFRSLYLDPARPPNLDAFNATFSHWQRVFRHAAPAVARSAAASTAASVSPALTPDAFFPALGVWVVRGRDRAGVLWELAAKAGHNDEHHNHNDVGSFILNINGVPLLTEIGAPEYVKDFFLPGKRYGFLAARSLGHSLPVVNGCEQGIGAEYRGEITTAECGEAVVSFEAELAAAYPAEAKLRRFTRRLELNKTAGEFRWSDEFILSAPGPVESALITDATEVAILSPGVALIEKAGRRLRLVAGVDALWDRVERHAYRDHSFKDAAITRLVLCPVAPARSLRFSVTATLAVETGMERVKKDSRARTDRPVKASFGRMLPVQAPAG